MTAKQPRSHQQLDDGDESQPSALSQKNNSIIFRLRTEWALLLIIVIGRKTKENSDNYQLGQIFTEGHLRCPKIQCVAKHESKDNIAGQLGRR